MKKRNKRKLTLAQKKKLMKKDSENPKGNSKYAKKRALQLKGIYSHRSPFGKNN